MVLESRTISRKTVLTLAGVLVPVALLLADATGDEKAVTVKELVKPFDAFYAHVARGDTKRLTQEFRLFEQKGYQIVSALQAAGRHEQALVYARRLCEMSDLFAEHMNKNRIEGSPFQVCRLVLEKVGDFETALAYELKNVEWNRKRDGYYVYSDLGRLAWRAGKVEESIKWYEREIKRDPQNLSAYEGLASVLIEGVKDKKRAAEVLAGGIGAGLTQLHSYSSSKEFRKKGVCLAPPGSERPKKLPFLPMSIVGGANNDYRKRHVKQQLDEGYIDITEDIRKLRIEYTKKFIEVFLDRYTALLCEPGGAADKKE